MFSQKVLLKKRSLGLKNYDLDKMKMQNRRKLPSNKLAYYLQDCYKLVKHHANFQESSFGNLEYLVNL